MRKTKGTVPKNGMRPVHPGEILREEYLVPLDMSANKLAQSIGVPANRISEIVGERRSVTAETALRFAAFFETSPQYWLNLQQQFDLRKAEIELAGRLRAIQPLSSTRT